jgi:hypothetical protein
MGVIRALADIWFASAEAPLGRSRDMELQMNGDATGSAVLKVALGVIYESGR